MRVRPAAMWATLGRSDIIRFPCPAARMTTWIGKGTSLYLLTLGGQDSNPLLQDQNLLCYRLHHPPKGNFMEVNGDRSCRTPYLRCYRLHHPPKGNFMEVNGDRSCRTPYLTVLPVTPPPKGELHGG